jgi:fatty acid desaturase
MESSGETALQNTTQCRPQMNDAVEKNQERSNPSRRDVMSVIPQACFERSLWRSCRHLAVSLTLTIGSGVLAYYFIPMTWAWLPAWILYAIVNGTFATGCWVMAHECGHRGFAKSAWLQDRIGFVLHSALLVPMWSTQHAMGGSMFRKT